MSPGAGRRIGGSFLLRWSRAERSGGLAPALAGGAAIGVDAGKGSNAGSLLFELAGGDRASDGTTLVAKLGGLRDAKGARLDAAALLSRRLATPESIDAAAITGNGLVLALDLRRPRFAAYSTLLAMPQLLFADTGDGFVAASEPRLLLDHLDEVAIDEESVPSHFLFRFVPGRRTYFRGVSRLFPGELLRFEQGARSLRRLRSLRELAAEVPRFDSIDEEGLAWLDREMAGTTAAWVAEAEAAGLRSGNLLSGGLDSSLVQSWLNDLGERVDRRSWSFTVGASSFDFEERYARDASALLGTDHRFASVAEAEYPALFDRAIDLVAEPSLYNEGWPCQLAAAELVASAPEAPGVLFAGNGADAIHGVGDLRAIVLWQQLSARPRRHARLGSQLEAIRRKVGATRSAMTWVEALEMRDEPESFVDPTSYVSIAGELAWAVPAFGRDAVWDAFETRRELERELYGSDELIERVQLLDLLTAGYDPTLSVERLYAAKGIDVVQLYLDEAAIAAQFAFPREIRYFRRSRAWGRRLKPLQQELLERRGLGELVGRPKGGTNFNDDLWRWLASGCLAERVAAIERPGWLTEAAFGEMKSRWNDFIWNLLVFDTWRRRVVEPAARAARARRA